MRNFNGSKMTHNNTSGGIEGDQPPKWLVEGTVEDLATQMAEYFLKISKDEEYIISDPELFWSEMGYSRFYVDNDKIRAKMSEVGRIARETIAKIVKERQKKQEQEENDRLPQIISDCVTWMKENGFGKKLTKNYLNLFLKDKDLQLLDITVARLYVKCNERLKKG